MSGLPAHPRPSHPSAAPACTGDGSNGGHRSRLNELAHRADATPARDRDVADALRRLETAIARAAGADDPGRLAALLSAEAHDIAAATVTVVIQGADRSSFEARDGVLVDRAPARAARIAAPGREPVVATFAEGDVALEDLPAPAAVQRLPLVDGGKVVGAMVVEYAAGGGVPDEEKLALVRALAAAVGPTAGRLLERGSREAERGDAARPSDAARAERTRIARELHDGLIQSLYGMGLLIRTQAERTDLPERGRLRMQGWVRRIDSLVDEATAYIGDLEGRGDALIDLGAGIDAIAEEAAAAGLDVSTEVNSTDDTHLPPEISHELLGVAREAASNTIRHAGARRLAIRVEVDPSADTVTLTIDDDGGGFEPAIHRPGGHGLDNMAARAAALKGSLDVISRRYAGTRVRLRVPLRPGGPTPVERTAATPTGEAGD